MADMALTGEYVPSTSQWVRDQVEAFEASDGQEANTLPDHPEWLHVKRSR